MRLQHARPALFLPAVILTLSTLGCAVTMAATQPPKRDLSLFRPGTPRPLLIEEIGAPVASEEVDGVQIDTFVFQQGYSKEVRALRAMFHGAADLASLGLWEFAATPIEAHWDGTKVRVQVHYDGIQRVRYTDVYSGEKVLRSALGESDGNRSGNRSVRPHLAAQAPEPAEGELPEP